MATPEFLSSGAKTCTPRKALRPTRPSASWSIHTDFARPPLRFPSILTRFRARRCTLKDSTRSESSSRRRAS
eukprot:2699152-Lingulodinium_polyedra.AAC.1